MSRCLPSFLFLAFSLSAAFAEDEDSAERKAYLAKRAAEKGAAEKAVKELGARDYGTLAADEFIRLAYAYNELGDNRLALDAICRVPDEVLAEKKQLEMKSICFGNLSSGGDKSLQLRELAFIDRCLDKKYGKEGVWLWRKARLLCQASVAPAIPTRGDVIGHERSIIDRQQYEYSFELLQRAFAAEPKLLSLVEIGPSFSRDLDFPVLSDEARFKVLMKK